MSPFGRAFADGDRLEVAGAVVRLRVHRRARRVSLRLDRTKREIVATAPSARRLSEAAAFARDRANWIAERLAELPETQTLAPGMLIDVFGEPVRLEAGSGRARWIAPDDGSTTRITASVENCIVPTKTGRPSPRYGATRSNGASETLRPARFAERSRSRSTTSIASG